MKVTNRAMRTETRVSVLPTSGCARAVHVLPIPRGACPVSGNPVAGVAVVRYTGAACVAEVVTLLAALRWGCSGEDGAPRSVEELAAWFSQEVSAAVGVAASCSVWVLVRPGPQLLVASAP